MKVTYFLNCMGPVNRKWLEENGQDWRGGRIDIEDGSDYGNEYSMPIVRASTWYKLQEWLDDTSTDDVVPLQHLLKAFGAEVPWTIEWFKEPDEWVMNQKII